MPSSIGHALVAGAVGAVMAPAQTTRRYWIAGIACAIVLDIDAIGRPFGRGDVDFLGGHRALTHSVPFAVMLGMVVTATTLRAVRWNGERVRIMAYLVLATMLHGALDAFASYGEGVAFLLPFSATRFASPWQPLRALNEIWLVWLPTTLVILGVRWRKR